MVHNVKRDPEKVLNELEYISQAERLDYESLREKHGKLMVWAKVNLKHEEKSLKLIREIEKDSLIRSVQEAFPDGEVAGLKKAEKSFPGLVRAARQVYKSNSWRSLFRDAGVRTVDLGAGEMCKFQESYLDFREIAVSLWREVGLGKFSKPEREKCIFNTLASADYPFFHLNSRIEKSTDAAAFSGVQLVRGRNYFGGRISTSLCQCVLEGCQDIFEVSMFLHNVPNKIGNARFYFGGEKAGREAVDFYQWMERTIGQFERPRKREERVIVGFNGAVKVSDKPYGAEVFV